MRSIIESPWTLAAGALPAAAGAFSSPVLAVFIAVAWSVAWLLARRWWAGPSSTGRRIVLGTALGLAVFFIVAQGVPYGRSHTNPAVVGEPAWDSAATRALAVASCFDCHSNETSWPWYTDVAPISWLAYNHVVEGRQTLNFSEWNRPQESGEVAEAILEGSMPPLYYRLLHPGSGLSDAEKAQLIAGLNATIQASPPGG